MSFYEYRDWQISIAPIRRGWMFRVNAFESEKDAVSVSCTYQSFEEALYWAYQYIDFQIACQDVHQLILTNLDSLLEQNQINTRLYVWGVRFLRDGLSFDWTKPD